MAERILKTTLKLDGAKEFNRNLKSVNSEVSVLKSEFKALSAAYDSGDKSIQNFTAMHRNLQQQVEIQKSKVEALKGAVETQNQTFEQAKSRLEETKRKYEEIAQAQGKNSDGAKKAAEEMQKASNAVNTAGNQLDSYRRQLANAQTALVSSTNALRNFEQAHQTDKPKKFLDVLKSLSEISFEAVSDGLKTVAANSLKAAEAAAKISFKAAETTAQAYFKTTETGFKAGLSAVETYVKALGTAAAAIGSVSAKTGMNFDAQMSTVKAISGATAEEFEQLIQKAKETGAATSFSAAESAKAMEYMAMAGWDTSAITNGLNGIVRLAESSGEELGTVSDIVTDAMTAFGLTADKASRFSDVLAKTASSANTNVGMMGETFKNVAPLAGAMNYTLEDMSAAVGLMANAGIKGSNSGTALRNIISNLASPSAEAAEAMEKLGISLTNQDGTIKSFRETLGTMRSAFAGLSEIEKAQYANAIAGKYGMSGLIAMVNASDEDFDKLRDSIDNCTGAAEEMAKVKIDNLQGDITLLKSSLEGAAISISGNMTPNLRNAVQNVKSVVDAFNSGGLDAAAERYSELIPKAFEKINAKLPNLISDMTKNFNKVSMLILDTAKQAIPTIRMYVIPQVLEGVTSLAEQAAELLPTMSHQLFSAALDFFGGIFDGLSRAAKKLNPMIPQMVRTLANDLTKKAPELFSKTLEFFGNITKAAAMALGQIIPKVPELAAGLAKELVSPENIGRFKETGKAFFESLTDGFKNANPSFKPFLQKISSAFGSIANFVQGIRFDKIAESLGGLLNSAAPLLDTLGNAFSYALNNAVLPLIQWGTNEILPSLFDGLSGTVTLLKNALELLAVPAKAVWEEFLQPLAGWTADTVSVLLSGITDSVKSLADEFDGADWEGWWLDIDNFAGNWAIGSQSIGDALESAGKDIDDFFNVTEEGRNWNEFWQNVGGTVCTVMETAKNAVGGLGTKWADFKDSWAAGTDTIIGRINDFRSNWYTGALVIAGNIRELRTRWNEHRDNWAAGTDTIIGRINDFRSNWHTGALVIAGNIRELRTRWAELADSWAVGADSIRNTIGGLIGNAWNWGSDIINNFVSGAKSMWDSWESTWEDFGGLIYDLLHHSTPERGLLKDDDEWMPDLMKNFADGIHNNIGLVTKQAENLTEQLRDSLQTDFELDINAPQKSLLYGLSAVETAGNSYSTADNRRISYDMPIYITIQEAKLDSSQDIRLTAQLLALETKRNLQGIGMI